VNDPNSPVTAEDARLWPRYLEPSDLTEIEKIPLDSRGLPETTYAVLRRAAERWPDRRAITVIHDAKHFADAPSWTFAELSARTDRIASVLLATGIRRRDAVGLVSPNVADLIMTILAAEAVGLAAPANPALSGDHVIDLFRRGGVRVIVAAGPEIDEEIWAKARIVAEALGVTALYALRPTTRPEHAPRLEPVRGIETGYLDDAVAASDPSLVATPPKASDLASLFHTGGTTGKPKLAAHTHRNEVTNAWGVAANGLIPADGTLLGALPLFHVNALVVTLLAPLLRGQSVVWAGPLGYRDRDFVERIWKIIEHYRIATLSGVPTVYATLAGVPVDADVSSMVFGVVGASPLPRAVRDRFTSATGIPLFEGYGLSEGTCSTARGFPDHPRPGSVGQRMPYQHVRIAEVASATGERRDVELGASGSILIDGPGVFPGYVIGHGDDGPILDSLGSVVDGWLDTGDTGRLDQDDFLFLTGRVKDLIIRGGHNIDPVTIENAMLGHPDVTGANAVGRPDIHAGEVPVVYVTLRENATTTAKELITWGVSTAPEPASAPKDVVIVSSLPLTAVGKANKLPLRADATTTAVRTALEAAGLSAEVTCQQGDSLVVWVTSAEPVERVAVVLDQFGLQWRFSAAAPAVS
jgi:fatty-acyl-CoA synthase